MKRFSMEDARRVGREIGADWSAVSLAEFRRGLEAEHERAEHDGSRVIDPEDTTALGRVALSNLEEDADHYARLEQTQNESGRP